MKPYTPEEDEILKQYPERSAVDIGNEIGRTAASVRTRANTIKRGEQVKTSINWTEDMIDKMLSMRADGRSASQIGKAIGVTKSAVIGKWTRLAGKKYVAPTKKEDPDEKLRRQAFIEKFKRGWELVKSEARL